MSLSWFFHIFVCLLPLFSATPCFSFLLLHRHPNLLQSQSSSCWQCWPLQCKLLLFSPLLLQLFRRQILRGLLLIFAGPAIFPPPACFISNFPHKVGFVFSWIFVSSLCFFVPIVITTHLSSINLRFFSIITLDIFSLGEAKTKI